jgi:2-polyprenyl-3-methyl-5-hydroxy-6-metoxy-1,4-benzoquinol methylase
LSYQTSKTQHPEIPFVPVRGYDYHTVAVPNFRHNDQIKLNHCLQQQPDPMTSIAPGLFLRQSCVQDLTAELPPDKFLEVGAGVGMMTRIFLERGFHGCCFDPSRESRQIIRQELAGYDAQLEIIHELSDLGDRQFNYLFAFEVLEHIEDHHHALACWTRYLKPGGIMVLSVPAHQAKYSRADELVGHVRRYERSDVYELLHSQGFSQIKIVNYGYPLTTVSGFASSLLLKRQEHIEEVSRIERSLQSSYNRTKIINKVLSIINSKIYSPFRHIQRLFYNHDLGNGMVVVSKKQSPTNLTSKMR